MKTLGATEAKTHLLSLLNDVEQKREGFVLSRNGKNVAQLLPMPQSGDDPIFGFYRGKVELRGDILAPLYTDDELEEFEEQSAAQLR